MAENVIYECPRCGHKARSDEWQREGTIVFKCPNCRYRVAKKIRPPLVKKVKTR